MEFKQGNYLIPFCTGISRGSKNLPCKANTNIHAA